MKVRLIQLDLLDHCFYFDNDQLEAADHNQVLLEVCALYSTGIDVLFLSLRFHDWKGFLLLLVDCLEGWQSACSPYMRSWIQSQH